MILAGLNRHMDVYVRALREYDDVEGTRGWHGYLNGRWKSGEES